MIKLLDFLVQRISEFLGAKQVPIKITEKVLKKNSKENGNRCEIERRWK